MANRHGVEASVIVPIYNEEKHIRTCVESLLKQSYPKEQLEILFIDGKSTDRTVEILKEYIDQYEQFQLLINEKKTVPYAMNMGINQANGQYIVRLDGHSEYPSDYISLCIDYLEKTGADNVGGLAIAKSRGFIGKVISIVLSSKFGVGNSSFRTNGEEGYVDTVPFGAFRKDVFTRFGYYDTRLTRNQDIELNHRINKNGGKVYLTPEIRLYYYNRENLRSFMKQSYQNGYWNILTWYICPGSLSLRHFVPFLFVMSFLLFPILYLLTGFVYFQYINLLVVALYLITNLIFSIRASRKSGLENLLILPLVYFLLHFSYGFGSLVSLGKVLSGGIKKKSCGVSHG
jgi:glycosyltransferase involved in cell wall biosynthesis